MEREFKDFYEAIVAGDLLKAKEAAEKMLKEWLDSL